jgi:hypothetical protein
MSLLVILLLLIIVFMVFVQVFNYYKNKTAINGGYYLKTGLPQVKYEDLKDAGTSVYSLELWIYANSVNGAKPAIGSTSYGTTNNVSGNIFQIMSAASGGSNILSLDLFNTGSAYLTYGTTPSSQIITDNFQVQRWEYVVINVNNKFIEIYLDGKLLKSINSKDTTFVAPSNKSVIDFGKGDIFIYQFNRYTKTMNSTEVSKKYLAGNNLSMSPGITMDIDFLKNNRSQVNYQLL